MDWDASDGVAEAARIRSFSSKYEGFSMPEFCSSDCLSPSRLKSTSVGPFSVAPELLPPDGCSGDCLLKSMAREWSGDSWPNSIDMVECSGDFESGRFVRLFDFGDVSGDIDMGRGLSSLDGDPSASWKVVGV